MNNNNFEINDFDDEVIIDEEMQKVFEQGDFEGAVRPNYMPYSQWRIKQILLVYYGIELRPYFNWYKAMRYRPCQQYVLVDMNTNEIIGYKRGYTFEELRCILAPYNFPLHDEALTKEIQRDKYKQAKKSKRNLNAERFLELVNNIKEGE
ncbi:MAG: hypothetical protein MRZ25_01345 [Ruminococcus sp.]|nr:hypothetical protein [Ruminococcus sp.]